ncbi:MAG: hypothetical protein COV96_01540 [Candidatus Zambryskibacteria bacterium CG11_big_fil_rev_8_21_14_0_20_42_18]|uniref:Transposase IS200-like domain-containing protein n=1 Tax=Candidatus Zambryskibacteria bacterium CG_4_9_14_3_um_filter_42_15 TaxID=1975112 RepID=A0A2M7WS63_9BACT|nr:MAG: hypothetical protein COV96_01540 [Candidatus Zambryskibacteria bacterium CG11_big_fil_rev_8_21_14_0_20_42_18]PJA32716.1 MAG: hypothetical protein CO185_01835 [Candidatus Zambryskibacteria bacterium CG_4_9_14_3_um_filter_42_15]
MASRKDPLVVNEYYHLYNRGVEKRKIFQSVNDYDHFIFLMYICNTAKSIVLRDVDKNFDRGETIVDIGAYCLMPNHFHILLKGKTDGGISNYMLKLLTAYSMYFNKKYKRTGRLFESVFKSSHVDSEEYLKYLYSYIHLNPAKLIDKNWRNNSDKSHEVLLRFVFTYKYSSLNHYLNIINNKILEPKQFPAYFLKPEDHRKELFEWLALAA